MPPSADADEFDLDSADEADLLELAVSSQVAKPEPSFDIDSAHEADLLQLSQEIMSGNGSNNKKRGLPTHEDTPASKRSARDISHFPSATKALTDIFGFKEFQLKQEQAITRVLSGHSAVVVFPTGGGKSLCFQIPALVFSEVDKLENTRKDGDHGLTLVVSPLIALMKDQVDALVRRGVKAASLDSSKSREEYIETCRMMESGELKMLYCAPERLNNEGFWQQMKYIRGGIRLLAVDEAHCISEWGHSFRPDYLKIARFVQEINAERVICLTATATPRVAKDICNAFNIDEAGLFRTTTYRPNLRLLAESGSTKKELYPRLYTFLRKNPGSSIVYVTLQRHTEELATLLKSQGFKAKAFHAGMPTETKTQLQDEFMGCDDLIIVATIAFGMGIDKASIRNVVHFNIPSSLESYSQEIGRAGRDGKTSNCMFYICGEDLHLREIFARGDLPSKESVRGLLNEIFDRDAVKLPLGGEITAFHGAQEKDYDIRSTTLKNIYAQLEITHGLIRASTPIYTKYNYKASGSYTSAMKADQSKAGIAVCSLGKLAKTQYGIDVDKAAATYGIPRDDIVKKLNDLNASGVIDLKPGGVMNVYKITKDLPKTKAEIETLVTAIHSIMETREQEALDRTDQMLALITGSECFSGSLARHFGDELNGKKECGHCTWCLTREAVVQEKPPTVPFDAKRFKAILDAVPCRDDPRLLAKLAFGISTPRITALKLGKSPLFASMEDHEFMGLLRAFTAICDDEKR